MLMNHLTPRHLGGAWRDVSRLCPVPDISRAGHTVCVSICVLMLNVISVLSVSTLVLQTIHRFHNHVNSSTFTPDVFSVADQITSCNPAKFSASVLSPAMARPGPGGRRGVARVHVEGMTCGKCVNFITTKVRDQCNGTIVCFVMSMFPHFRPPSCPVWRRW